MSGGADLEQNNLDDILDKVDVLSALAAVKVVGGDVQRNLGRSQCVLEAQLLLNEQVGLGDDVADLATQFRLPVVDVVQALRQSLRVGRLRPQRQRLGLFDHIARRVANLDDTADNRSSFTTIGARTCAQHYNNTHTVPSLPPLGPWAPHGRTGPSLESIYRVSLTVDLCEDNNSILIDFLCSY